MKMIREVGFIFKIFLMSWFSCFSMFNLFASNIYLTFFFLFYFRTVYTVLKYKAKSKTKIVNKNKKHYPITILL